MTRSWDKVNKSTTCLPGVGIELGAEKNRYKVGERRKGQTMLLYGGVKAQGEGEFENRCARTDGVWGGRRSKSVEPAATRNKEARH